MPGDRRARHDAPGSASIRSTLGSPTSFISDAASRLSEASPSTKHSEFAGSNSIAVPGELVRHASRAGIGRPGASRRTRSRRSRASLAVGDCCSGRAGAAGELQRLTVARGHHTAAARIRMRMLDGRFAVERMGHLVCLSIPPLPEGEATCQ